MERNWTLLSRLNKKPRKSGLAGKTMEATAGALLGMAGMTDAPEGVRAALARALDSEQVTEEDMCEVLPGRLWLGNWKTAKVASQLGVSMVVNCAGKSETPLEPVSVEMARLNMPDSPHPALDVRPLLREGATVIAAHARVAVHCLGGQNRSPAVCVAFLVLEMDMTLQEATLMVERARPIVKINPIYKLALQQLEKDKSAKLAWTADC